MSEGSTQDLTKGYSRHEEDGEGDSIVVGAHVEVALETGDCETIAEVSLLKLQEATGGVRRTHDVHFLYRTNAKSGERSETRVSRSVGVGPLTDVASVVEGRVIAGQLGIQGLPKDHDLS